MSIFVRKRKRSIQLNNRWGSRRNRILFATSLTLIAIASWLVSVGYEAPLTSYLVSTSNLATSSKLGEINTISVGMDLAQAQGQYLEASEKNLKSWVLVRPVNAGELIPLSSIAPERTTDCVQIVVALGVSLANTVKVGDSIDLWAADQANSIEAIPAQVVTAGELISTKTETESFSQSAQTIEICVSKAEIRSVVLALARKSVIVGIRSLD